jgi:hypothetical protein
LGSITLENETVEGIERQQTLIEDSRWGDLRKQTTFRRVWVDVIEMLEVRWIFEITECRDAVTLGAFRCLANPSEYRGKRRNADGERVTPSKPTRPMRFPCVHELLPHATIPVPQQENHRVLVGWAQVARCLLSSYKFAALVTHDDLNKSKR